MNGKLAPHIQKIRDGYGAKFDGRRSSVNQLKSCPFCGSTSREVVDREDNPDVEGVAIRCQNCGALGPYGGSLREAQENWNGRKESEK